MAAARARTGRSGGEEKRPGRSVPTSTVVRWTGARRRGHETGATRGRRSRDGGHARERRSWARWRWRPVARTKPPPTALKETLELRPSGRRITEARRLRQWWSPLVARTTGMRAAAMERAARGCCARRAQARSSPPRGSRPSGCHEWGAWLLLPVRRRAAARAGGEHAGGAAGRVHSRHRGLRAWAG
jgi:hypothetical protein